MDLIEEASNEEGLGGAEKIKIKNHGEITVALAGNPNTGKSTVFNGLTGLNQHTGNWPGKTVMSARGKYRYRGREYTLIDLPGTYSLMANSLEEHIAGEFICFGKPKVTVVITDATCLERNLNLVLQIMEITDRVVVCVNLMDEAARKDIDINLKKLSEILCVPVVGTSARSGKGLPSLMDAIEGVALGTITGKPFTVDYGETMENAIGRIGKSIRTLIESSVGGGKKEQLDNERPDSPLAERDINVRWAALRLIEDNGPLIKSIHEFLGFNLQREPCLQKKLRDIRTEFKGQGVSPEDIRDIIVSTIVKNAETIKRKTVILKEQNLRTSLDYKIDKVLTSKTFGIPIMITLLGLVFWLTIHGADVPSALLADGLFRIEKKALLLFNQVGVPAWISEVLLSGVYRTLAWVVSVMLPPMAIFFPLFTLLEDLGYLPRIAFNLDHYFKKACAHGKQALTMCMGFGCNAAGVVSCRIIDSPRERLIATITNNFVPCNGRFPILISVAVIFSAGSANSFNTMAVTVTVSIMVLLGIGLTLAVSKMLSKTILRGMPSSFALELPPYRKPQIGSIIVRSIFDRTLFVLGRAVVVAAPAGLIIWAMANINLGGINLLTHSTEFLDPFARFMGLDGHILMAFILGLPANEIVIPILLMSYTAGGTMVEPESMLRIRELLLANGWTWVTAVCAMLFALNHWPCGTTLLTIRKETLSWKWTWVSFLIPTMAGILLCIFFAQGVRLLGFN